MTLQNGFNNLINKATQVILGSDGLGDIYYRGANGLLNRLGIGSAGQILTVPTGSNPVPAWATPSVGIPWAVVSGTAQAAAVNTGYFANNAALVAITLPAAAAVGSLLEIVGVGSGGWRLAQAANQQVIFGSLTNTVGTAGQLNSTSARDAIRLVCVVQDTTWQVIGSVGNIDVI